jgi:hypothetical protein
MNPKKPYAPKFTIDCWDRTDDEAGFHYALGLSFQSLHNTDGCIHSSSTPIVSGKVVLHDDGKTYTVEPALEFPAAMVKQEAVTILAAIFEEMGRGGAYTDDWIWRPVALSAFLAQHFYSPRSQQVSQILIRHVEEIRCQRKSKIC